LLLLVVCCLGGNKPRTKYSHPCKDFISAADADVGFSQWSRRGVDLSGCSRGKEALLLLAVLAAPADDDTLEIDKRLKENNQLNLQFNMLLLWKQVLLL
jgi:hypothetical protein